MTDYAVAQLEEIGVVDDGRCPFRPVRQHFGITSFGVNAWTARKAGDRIINEHDESEPDGDEELYLVLHGHASFVLDGERIDAPAGTLVFARPGVRRTAFAEEPDTTILSLGATPGRPYEHGGWELWAPLRPLYDAGNFAEAAARGRRSRTTRRPRTSSTTSPAARASAASETLRSAISGARSTSPSRLACMRGAIPISIRFGTTRRSRSSSAPETRLADRIRAGTELKSSARADAHGDRRRDASPQQCDAQSSRWRAS